MTKNIGALILVLMLSHSMNSQSTIEGVLKSVSANNKTIKANTQYWETMKLEYQTGITPYDPSVQYDYMHGTPSNAGNQTDFSVTQAFDFPTAYFRKRELANQQMAQADIEMLTVKQNVLLEAKLVCIELIFCNKLKLELMKRQEEFEKFERAYQMKIDNGDGNILDLNKVKLQLIQVRKEYQENDVKISSLNFQLIALNGGLELSFQDTNYFESELPMSLEQLQIEVRNADPVSKSLEQQKLIAQKQVEVSQSLWLPKIEAGYHYQGILGQKYSGVHAGITIPLWEKKNTVQLQKAHVALADVTAQEYSNVVSSELSQKYTRLVQLKATLQQYETSLSSLNNFQFLERALNAGEISVLEYFMELSFYRTAMQNFWQTQKEYYTHLAELTKYQL